MCVSYEITSLWSCHLHLLHSCLSSVSEQCHQDLQIQHFHLPAAQPLRAVPEARQRLLPLPHDASGRHLSLPAVALWRMSTWTVCVGSFPHSSARMYEWVSWELTRFHWRVHHLWCVCFNFGLFSLCFSVWSALRNFDFCDGCETNWMYPTYSW